MECLRLSMMNEGGPRFLQIIVGTRDAPCVGSVGRNDRVESSMGPPTQEGRNLPFSRVWVGSK